MLATMRANSARPSPIPECSSACAGTLPTAPPALTLVYPDIVRCERVAVAAVVWNLDGGNLAATVIARERNDSRAISRNHAPATNTSRLAARDVWATHPRRLAKRHPNISVKSGPRYFPISHRLEVPAAIAPAFCGYA